MVSGTPTPFPLPTPATIAEVLQYANDVTGGSTADGTLGLFGTVFLVVVFAITFMATGLQSKERSFIVADLVTLIVAILLFPIGIIDPLIIMFLTGALIPALWFLYMT